MNSINLMGYGRKINEKQLQNRNEVYYEINQPTPYTGKIVNYYENCQIETKENYKDGKKGKRLSIMKTNYKQGKHMQGSFYIFIF